MRDASGSKLQEGDQVTLLHVTDAMVSGLPKEEIEFLRSMKGKSVVLSEVNETDIEIMMTDPKSGMMHFLRVTGTDVAGKTTSATDLD